MKTYLILLILICDTLYGIAQHKASDQVKIQGVWLAESESQNGIKKEVSFIYEFKENKIFFTDETGTKVTYSYKLDTTDKLKLIVLQKEEASSTPVSVAYELNGNWLTIVVAPPGLRPTDISDKNDQELIICKRKRL